MGEHEIFDIITKIMLQQIHTVDQVQQRAAIWTIYVTNNLKPDLTGFFLFCKLLLNNEKSRLRKSTLYNFASSSPESAWISISGLR